MNKPIFWLGILIQIFLGFEAFGDRDIYVNFYPYDDLYIVLSNPSDVDQEVTISFHAKYDIKLSDGTNSMGKGVATCSTVNSSTTTCTTNPITIVKGEGLIVSVNSTQGTQNMNKFSTAYGKIHIKGDTGFLIGKAASVVHSNSAFVFEHIRGGLPF